jgi:hypothetical protein
MTAMQPIPRFRVTAHVLIGMVIAAGAFGAAATMSAATAPTARADDLTYTVEGIEAELADGQAAFGTAASDFGGNDALGGVAFALYGLDDDLLGTSATAETGAVAELTDFPATGLEAGLFDFNNYTVPTSFSQALLDAQVEFNVGAGYLDDVASALSAGEYAQAVYDDAAGSIYGFDVPAEFLLIGALGSLGL